MSSSEWDHLEYPECPSSPETSLDGTSVNAGSDATSLSQQQISLCTPVSSESGSQRGHSHFQEDRDRRAEDKSQTHSLGALELDHGSAAVVEKVTHAAVRRFLSLRKSLSAKRSARPCAHQSRKRQRRCSPRAQATGVSHSDSEESDFAQSKQPMVFWPCPYFVQDREAYKSCLTRHCLLSLNDVREHLCLMHQIPIYCSVCYETFPTVTLRDSHMRSQECTWQQPKVFKGITDAQVRKLEEQVDLGDRILVLQQRHWLKFWHIVFPKIDPPASPFDFTKHELEVYEVRRFWNRAGKKITADALEPCELQEWTDGSEKRSLKALYSIISDCAVDEVLKA